MKRNKGSPELAAVDATSAVLWLAVGLFLKAPRRALSAVHPAFSVGTLAAGFSCFATGSS